MRMLFSFVGGSGHFEPLVPLARAAWAAGHTLAVTGRHAMVAAIEAAGFEALPLGAADSGPPERIPLQRVDMEREYRDLRDGFAGRLARRRAAEVSALCGSWRPDLVVCDEVDFGAMLAAEGLGLPYATVLVIAAGSFVRPDMLAGALGAVRAERGLPPDPGLAMLSRHLVLCPFPPGYRDPAFPLPATARLIRPPMPAPPGDARPAWAAHLGGAPTVYLTLGTVFNVESGDLFARALAGLRGLPVNVVATVGREIDPAELGPQPANVRIERYIPQAEVLPRCDAVVCHGGSGSVLGALAHGLPMLLIPLGADQPLNAARCAALGVARTLDPLDATPADVAAAATAVLGEPAYRRAAAALRDEIAAMPEVEAAVALLERL